MASLAEETAAVTKSPSALRAPATVDRVKLLSSTRSTRTGVTAISIAGVEAADHWSHTSRKTTTDDEAFSSGLTKDGCPDCLMCIDSQPYRCKSIRDSHLQ